MQTGFLSIKCWVGWVPRVIRASLFSVVAATAKRDTQSGVENKDEPKLHAICDLDIPAVSLV